MQKFTCPRQVAFSPNPQMPQKFKSADSKETASYSFLPDADCGTMPKRACPDASTISSPYVRISAATTLITCEKANSILHVKSMTDESCVVRLFVPTV